MISTMEPSTSIAKDDPLKEGKNIINQVRYKEIAQLKHWSCLGQ